uniref:Peptide chain release factor 1-like, mitochondrial n=1 Tax=Erpetoichthys calabaricus TaxID=27687 RepID=A0A8C4RI65_ERPCA
MFTFRCSYRTVKRLAVHLFPKREQFTLSSSSYGPTLQRNIKLLRSFRPGAVHGRAIQNPRHSGAEVRCFEEIFKKDSFQEFLKRLSDEYEGCIEKLNKSQDRDVKEEELRHLNKRITKLSPLMQHVNKLREKEREVQDNDALLQDEDPDIRELARTEKNLYNTSIQELKQKIISSLIPSEEADDNDIILEVTAGVGGQEAMLFTSEMFEMYQNFAAYKRWNFEILEYFQSELGGLRHAMASISGQDGYQHMKYEGGVHRVQRVPKTEKQGRIHTSTMTVAVLSQPAEIDFTINAKDLRIETKRASGAGGQHVNTTDSAVRIVHLPTGIVAECQQERSQIKNKEKAMQVLRAKIYSMKLEKETSKRYNARKVQIGTKGRSEKIRTYNYPQDRITDHRISKTIHDVKQFLMGEELLDEMIQSLKEYSEMESVLDMLESMHTTS